MRHYGMHVQQMISSGRRRTTSVWYLAAAACIGLAGCGRGGGGADDEVVRLAVGTRVVEDDHTSRALILRNAGGEWEPVGENVGELQRLTQVVFASPDVAWAYGGGLVRSLDRGLTWEDVGSKLPPEVRDGPYLLQSLAFADATTGYLGTLLVIQGGARLEGPYVWVTHDGGETWSPVSDVAIVPDEVGFTLGVRRGATEVLRHPVSGAVGAIVETIAGAAFDPQTVATKPSTIRRGFETRGARGWIAFHVVENDDVRQGRPKILTSARPGSPWVEAKIPDVPVIEFGAIDMCDDRIGLAGGAQLAETFTPVVLWTEDGGSEWQSSTFGGSTRGFGLFDVACAGTREMWVVLTSLAGEGAALYESTDGGRAFARVAFPLSDQSEVYGLASNQ